MDRIEYYTFDSVYFLFSLANICDSGSHCGMLNPHVQNTLLVMICFLLCFILYFCIISCHSLHLYYYYYHCHSFIHYAFLVSSSAVVFPSDISAFMFGSEPCACLSLCHTTPPGAFGICFSDASFPSRLTSFPLSY